MRKAEPAKPFRQSGPETLASSYFELPPYHTHKPHRKIVSLPSYLCLLAIRVFMPSPGLMPLLPAFTVFCLLFSGAVRSSWTPQRRPRGGGFGHGLSGGCVHCRNKVTYTWFMGSFEQCSHSPSLANVRTDGFNFFPSLPLWGVFPRFYIP